MSQPVRPPPDQIDFTIVISVWVVKDGPRGQTEELDSETVHFRGTLAGAKASLAKREFYVAKIYEGKTLVAKVRGAQPNHPPHPVS
jgi:hypothetical protein